MAENVMLNSVGAINQPCLTPLITGNGPVYCPFHSDHEIAGACNHWYEPGWTAKLVHYFPKSTTTASKALVRSTKVIHRLMFCYWSCFCKDHAFASSVFPESKLTFWQTSNLITSKTMWAMTRNWCKQNQTIAIVIKITKFANRHDTMRW